jgi:V/A-type H+-transporting ATPase subunit E
MGALENITERIKKDASSKANKTIANAKKEADEILKRANEELEKEKKALEIETEKIIKIQKNRAVSEAKLEARKMNLAAKEEVITKAFELANERLKNLGPTETQGYLKKAITDAVALLGNDVEVRCNEKDASTISGIAKGISSTISVSSTGVDFLGGCVVRAKNQTAQIDATFEGVMKRIRGDLRRDVANILFSEKEKKEA